VVLDPPGRVLLTLHPKFGLWLQLGGHLEPGDANLAAAAAREAAEESGIPGLVPTGGIVDIDVHSVPCPAPGGAHHDLRYVFLAPAGAVAVRSAESLEVAWFDTLPDATDDSVRRAVAAARRCLGSHPRPVGTPE
jgi:8-oxo-dGTP pyrophosphatase MutT (NUDIX family)